MPLLRRIIIAGNLLSKRPLTSSFIRLAKRQDNSSSSDSDSSSDDEKRVKKSVPPKQKPNEDSINKLNALLQDIVKAEKTVSKEDVKLNLAKPREKQRQKDLQDKEKRDRKMFGEKLIGAAKGAAEELGGDVKQTETELLARLLYKSKLVQDEAKQETDHSTDNSSEKLDPKKKLGSLTLNELLTGMKIDRSEPKHDVSQLESRADQVRNILLQKKKPQVTRADTFRSRQLRPESKNIIPGERVNLFAAEPLGIFKQTDLGQKTKDEAVLETWERCFSRELKLATTQPPTNIYEQMILWTEKGMLWHFPIDNEQGLEEEKKVQFYEHVHLEHHIDEWCPDRGPIRHFMELVCVGLSKNPWLTVDEKLQHIWWFRDFFTAKANLIKDIGAGEIKVESSQQISP